MELLIALVLATYHPPVVALAFEPADTGMGKCKHIDQHYHTAEGLCHRDKDDSPVIPLPVPVALL